MAQRVSHLSQSELEELHQLLQAKRHEVAEDITQLAQQLEEEKDPNDTGGGLSSLPTHPADLGTDEYEKEINTEQMLRQQSLLIELDEALERMEEGTYGICQGTGEQINIERLRAKPWAKYSLEYERQLEGRR